MAAPRSTVTIDGNKFDAVSCSVVLSTLSDRAGAPEMGSLTTAIRVWVDFHDEKNMPNGTITKLFDLAKVVTRDKIKDMKIEFWQDESKKNALCSYKFKGWVSRFETTNPMPTAAPQSQGADTSPYSTINHLLVLDLQPRMNQENISDLTIGN
jgi:hypothetical protein